MVGSCESVLEQKHGKPAWASKCFRLKTVMDLRWKAILPSTRVATRVTPVPFLGRGFFVFFAGAAHMPIECMKRRKQHA
ncbi:hypothetical protein B9K06_24795 [Bacillus sp. OG2]|nr:hypothetical protein B9K06_24795 [Bacillus sp. OG2]